MSQRWSEEKKLVANEMQWTVRYFLKQAQDWQQVPVRYPSSALGAVAYAARQSAQWKELAGRANLLFSINNIDYQSPMSL